MPKMFKTLSAALVVASVMLAPMAVSANAAQAAKPVATKQVTMVKKHARHAVRHHKSTKFVKQARHLKTFVHKRHSKIVKAHKRAHVVAAKARVQAN
jgi:Ni/Co efflux regulator RcnB